MSEPQDEADTIKHKRTTRVADVPAPKTTDPSKPKATKPGTVPAPKQSNSVVQEERTERGSSDGFRAAIALLAKRMYEHAFQATSLTTKVGSGVGGMGPQSTGIGDMFRSVLAEANQLSVAISVPAGDYHALRPELQSLKFAVGEYKQRLAKADAFLQKHGEGLGIDLRELDVAVESIFKKVGDDIGNEPTASVATDNEGVVLGAMVDKNVSAAIEVVNQIRLRFHGKNGTILRPDVELMNSHLELLDGISLDSMADAAQFKARAKRVAMMSEMIAKLEEDASGLKVSSLLSKSVTLAKSIGKKAGLK